MKPRELIEFKNLTDSVGYAKTYHLKIDNSAVIVEYDCLSRRFIVTRNYEHFKGNTYNTGNPVTAKNYIFILSHIKNNDDAERLIFICGTNSGDELQSLREQIAIDHHLELSPEEYQIFGISQEFLKLCRTAKQYGI